MLRVDGIEKSYRIGGWLSRERRQALHAVSFEWKQGECLGLIGESGSGKSTLGRLLLGIERPDRGAVTLDGKPVWDRKARKGKISAVFQDYTSSINPFYTVEKAIAEPLGLQGASREETDAKVELLLYQVGLDPSYRRKYPHQLSGGEAQRVCIARAVAAEPAYILFDEAVSALDGPVQVQVLELLRSLRRLYGMGFLFITHDIQAAAYLCDRVMIMRGGRIEETAEIERLNDVQSDYARKLLQAVMT